MLLLNLYDLLLIEQNLLPKTTRIPKSNAACVFFLLFSFFRTFARRCNVVDQFSSLSSLSLSACLCSHIGTPTHHFLSRSLLLLLLFLSFAVCFYSITVSFILRSDNEEYRNLCICLCICLCVREKKNLISFSHICSFVRLFRIIGADFPFLLLLLHLSFLFFVSLKRKKATNTSMCVLRFRFNR